MFNRFYFGVVASAFLLFAAHPAPAGTAAWEFNFDLSSSTGQAPLVSVGYPGVGGGPSVTFEGNDIGGVTAIVARLSKGTALAVLHGFPKNGGGSYLNQYTIIMDVQFPAIGDWISLYQTNEAYDDAMGRYDLSDSNDGDWFIDTNGGIGTQGVYGGTLEAETWYRMALVVDLTQGSFTSYIDGVQVQQILGQGLDGRYALYTNDDPDPYDWFFLFADETAGAVEMGEVVINSFHFLDRALAAGEIAELGGPDADGIGSPPPVHAPALGALGFASLAAGSLAAGIVALRRRANEPT